MFQLTAEELAALRSQIATSNASAPQGRGGRRYLPYAFTEHGAIMAATILGRQLGSPFRRGCQLARKGFSAMKR